MSRHENEGCQCQLCRMDRLGHGNVLVACGCEYGHTKSGACFVAEFCNACTNNGKRKSQDVRRKTSAQRTTMSAKSAKGATPRK